MNSFQMVREFHEKFGLPILDKPQFPRDSRVVLRLELIAEEFQELGMAVAHENIVEVADALADLRYVVEGMALEFGIDLDTVTREVHRSNMSKLGEDGKPIYRQDGKVMKGPDFTPPNIKEVLGV